ncbi:hypothetical protein Tco_0762216 [Tanacetum coccineum]
MRSLHSAVGLMAFYKSPTQRSRARVVGEELFPHAAWHHLISPRGNPTRPLTRPDPAADPARFIVPACGSQWSALDSPLAKLTVVCSRVGGRASTVGFGLPRGLNEMGLRGMRKIIPLTSIELDLWVGDYRKPTGETTASMQ